MGTFRKSNSPSDIPSLVSLSPSRIPLAPQLWFDPDSCAIIAGDEHYSDHSINLTDREARLLSILLATPRRFYSAEHLAHLLRKRGTASSTAHSVVQTVYGLRKKLGDDGRCPLLLRSRRDIGYAVYPLNLRPH